MKNIGKPKTNVQLCVDLEGLRTFETPNRQLYALYAAPGYDRGAFMFDEGDDQVWVFLVNIIHGTGEIRWHVPTWKSMEEQYEDDRLAIEHFDLAY